jgi:simple sugar transport system ATP-binding protein
MAQIEMAGVTKQFGTTLANNQIDFSVEQGEIHSLLGENGAGKTTLMRILYGLIQPDKGEIRLNGRAVRFKSPLDAIGAGIAMVHQHFMLIEPLTVAENMVLGQEPKRGVRFDFDKAVTHVAELSRQYGLHVDPKARIENLPVGAKQRVEILKALYRKADILILDEPTAVLTPSEVDELFSVLDKLRKNGKTVIIISHKLNETMKIADRVTILNGGRRVVTQKTADTNPRQLAEQMVGHSVSFEVIRRESPVKSGADPILELRSAGYSCDGLQCLKNLNLQLYRGEILGIAGVEGNGQTELAEAVCGLFRLTEGEYWFDGQKLESISADKMLRLGVANIPEDRGKRGLVKDFQIQENLVLGYHGRKPFSRGGILNLREISRCAETMCKNYDVRMSSVTAPAGSLSGGNAQKLVVARALSYGPRVLVAAQPTRGVDIGAIEYIHQKLIDFKEEGNAVLLISAEIDEIMKLSDRVAVLYGGTIVAQDKTENFDGYRLGGLMTGLGGKEV